MDSASSNSAVSRLLSIDWGAAETGRRSHAALMREYLRRAALWANVLHMTSSWPFFDAAHVIAADIRAKERDIAPIERIMTSCSYCPTIKTTCIWFLHWEHLKSERPAAVAHFEIADMFEPLLRFYERGGRFYLEHGYINIDMIGIPAMVRGWQSFESMDSIALDDQYLDSVDRRRV